MVRRRTDEVELKFRRDLGLRDIVMIGLGPTIGTTIFLLVGPGIGIAGGSLVLVFFLTFLVTILTAQAYAELSSAFPETGGGYLWVKNAMRQPMGFLAGWLGWFGHSIVCSFYVLSFGLGVVLFLDANSLVITFWSSADRLWLAKALALIVLGVFIYVNYRGTRTTGRLSVIITFALLAIVITYALAGVAWFLTHDLPTSNLEPFFLYDTLGENALSILMAMGFTFIVFEGYEIIAQTGEETKDPGHNIPRANWIVLTTATAIFVVVAFVTSAQIGVPTAVATPLDEQPLIVALVASRFLPFGLEIIAFGMIFGSLAALNSMVFSASRVAFAMGRDRSLPRVFGRLHRRNRTPFVAIIASGVLVGLFVAGLDVRSIAASAGIMFLILFVLVNAAVLILRRTMPNTPRTYRVPAVPVTPVAAIIGNGVLVVALLFLESSAVILGLVWIALGLVIHYAWAKRERIAEVAGPILEAIIPLPEEKYHILVAVENTSDTALVEFAALVGKVEGAEVTLMHVIEVPSTLPIDAIDRLYAFEVRRNMGDLRKLVSDARVSVTARVVVSHEVAEAVLESVEKEDVNLLIVGWKGTRRRGLVLGSNIDRFVQEAPCDIVVFKIAGLKPKPERILLMNAPEWHVSYATGYAILLAKKHRASITIFSAAQTEMELNQEKAYSNRLATMCQTHGVPVEEKFAKVRSIVDAVVDESRRYDLLVVGASSEWRLTQFAFGAMQDQIARRVDCPVLMVRKVRRQEESRQPAP